MVKTNVRILKHENKTGASGTDYTRFQCEFENNGVKWMSAFETDLIEELKKVEGKNELVNIDVAEVKNKDPSKPNFFNIRGIGTSDAEEDPEIAFLAPANLKKETFPKPVVVMPDRKSVKNTAYEKDPVGLAVEVFNGLAAQVPENNFPAEILRNLMLQSIDLVKQAQEAFK
jgi:hypothetical protein